MTSIDYELVFSNFLGSINDPSFAKNDLSTAYQQMTEWLHRASANPYIQNLFTSFTLFDDMQCLKFEMLHPSDNADMDNEFVCEVLAKEMVLQWLRPSLQSKTLVAQFFGGSEQKFYAQSNQLAETRSLYETTREEVKAMIRDRGVIHNSYLEADTNVEL